MQPTLTVGEKLIVSMLCELYRALKINSDIDPAFGLAAIRGGHLWALKMTYEGVFGAEEYPDETRSEVWEILSLWSMIEDTFNKLSTADKEKLAASSSTVRCAFAASTAARGASCP